MPISRDGLILVVDCGTTNSRAYIVNQQGIVLGRSVREIGVRATALDGSTKRLVQGLSEIVSEALVAAGRPAEHVELSIAVGMITSEIGLKEIPHLLAPAGLPDLAAGAALVSPAVELLPGVPCYFARGVKNSSAATAREFSDGLYLDFMRGEETQIAGLLEIVDPKLPVVCVVLSSHTKFVVVDEKARIAGSLTTMSGQVYKALLDGTIVGKSVEEDDREALVVPDTVVDVARKATLSAGLLRSLFVPRFMDTLISTTAADRRLFVQACIAFEDSRALAFFDAMGLSVPDNAVLIGTESRASLYRTLLIEEKFLNVSVYSDQEQIHELTVAGALALARARGLLPSRR
jgi:2-dehydro-3-deoxygalactonokinase